MTHRQIPRQPRRIGRRTEVVLPFIGFRYSGARDAWVLRLVGNWFGPVLQR